MRRRELSPQDARALQLGVLDVVAQWCAARGVSYQLAFGTLLGAVRHGGYIPWDDDIDIAMPRTDYERFCREFSTDGPVGMAVGSLATDRAWPLPFAKVWDRRTLTQERSHLRLAAGVGLDVFPIDNLSDHGTRRTLQLAATQATRRIGALASVQPRTGRRPAKEMVLRALGPAARAAGPSRLGRARDMVATTSPRTGSYASILAGPYNFVAPSSAFSSTASIRFEHLRVAGPADTHSVLSAIYGDYRTPPPTDQRVTHHAATSWWVSD